MTRNRVVLRILICLFMLMTLFQQTTQASARKQEISTNEIISRASNWVSRGISYSQSTIGSDGYRQDCSGFVSFVWQLTDSSGRPESRNTGTLAQVAFPIDKNSLRAGDILLKSGHVVIFASWANSTKTRYWVYEMTPPKAVYREIPYPYYNNDTSYKPYRYNGITTSSNFAYKRAVSATSIENTIFSPGKAVDGNLMTRWSSAPTPSTQWLIIDMGTSYTFDQVTIMWERAYARDYFVGWSGDCKSFSGYYRSKTSAQKDVINLSSTRTARCIGIKMTAKASGYGNYSIWEVLVYKR